MNFLKRFLKQNSPPRADRIAHSVTRHGRTIDDAYFWLRNRDNPDVIAYLDAENKFTDQAMLLTEPLQEKLYEEMVSRMKEDDSSVPEKNGPYFYYSRNEKNRQYKIFGRKKESVEAAEEIVLDANRLADGLPYFSLGVFEVSDNHELLAYSTDTDGSEKYDLRILEISTGKILDSISNTYYHVEWAGDHRTLFYTELDHASRPYRVYRHTVGEKSELVYEEPDERFFVELSKSRDARFIFIHLQSKITSEIRMIRCDAPRNEPIIFSPRQQGIEYSITSWEDFIFVVTNENAKNFKLMQTGTDAFEKAVWKEIIPHREEVMLLGVEPFRNHLVLLERRGGFKQLRIRNMKTWTDHEIVFPEPSYNLQLSQNPQYDSPTLRFSYTSLVTPWTVIDYDMNSRSWTIKKQDEVIGYDVKKYVCERHWATAQDGTNIPISLVYKNGISRDGKSPLLLYGYGSYGSNTETNFSSPRVSLLDRGWIFAIGHIRGGEEMGRAWYEKGKLLNKKNTFTDFIACAEFLIREKYTSPKHLSIVGGSAGGLLVGAVLNLRPELINSAVAHVPFVDVVNTMCDATLPLTVTEYEEWGDPNEKDFYEYMISYSPYDNVAKKHYPHLLITAGLNDPRVSYWEPAKWVAKLRVLNRSSKTILLRTHMEFGHGGASGRYDYLREIAFDYAFLIHHAGK